MSSKEFRIGSREQQSSFTGSEEMADKLKEIKLDLIKENPVALRAVNRQDEGFQGLVDSIRDNGVLNAILVREMKDEETGETYYGLIDGLQRFSASRDAGRETIPALVKSMDDAAVLEAQVITNVHKIETKPVQYTTQLIRILAGNPTMTVADLARKLSKSATWLHERLGLAKLSKPIAELVDDNKINLSNAYALARLPEEEQTAFIDRAITMPPAEFVQQANSRAKELKDAKRQGRDPNAPSFTPMPVLQKLADLKSEWESPVILPKLIAASGITDPVEAAKLTLAWTLKMDPDSQAAALANHEARIAQQKAEKEKRAEEARKKRAEAAAAAQVNAEEATAPAAAVA